MPLRLSLVHPAMRIAARWVREVIDAVLAVLTQKYDDKEQEYHQDVVVSQERDEPELALARLVHVYLRTRVGAVPVPSDLEPGHGCARASWIAYGAW
jgi:hypothetical protein